VPVLALFSEGPGCGEHFVASLQAEEKFKSFRENYI
jgi:hypothetical protein